MNTSKNASRLLLSAGSIVAIVTASAIAQTEPASREVDYREAALAKLPPNLKRMRYNNPGLHVDLGVGLWGSALPLDVDGDGKPELVVGWGGRPVAGAMLYDRQGGPTSTLFKRGRLIHRGGPNLQTSFDGGRWFVTSYGKWYPDFLTEGAKGGDMLRFTPKFEMANKRQCLWRLYDYDGDGVQDLLISAYDSRDYGWDNAYNANGTWTNGPQRAFFYWVKNSGTLDNPRFGEAQQLMVGDKPMQVFGLPTPNFADIDGDGLRDIVSGDGMDFITWFKNVGTPTEPKFLPGQPLRRDGSVIQLDLEMINPAAMDYDGDGDIDLVVAEEDGRVAVMFNTGKLRDGQPVFDRPVYLKEEAEELKFGILNTPFGVDLDGDGDDDFVSGNSAGYIAFIENLGDSGNGEPKWAAPRVLEADGKPIRIMAGVNGSIQGPAEGKWGYTAVSVADYDGDGLLDLVANSSWGKIVWFRNTGTKSQPTFAAAQAVQVNWGDTPRQWPDWLWWTPEGNDLATQWRTSVVAMDLTGDGITDLVALDPDGFLALYEGTTVDGKRMVLPPKRVFELEPDALNGTDHVGAPQPLDLDGDGKQDVTHVNAAGHLGFYYRVPGIPGNTTRFVYRGDDERYKQGDEINAFRVNSGYAGRSGRRKFVLTDWDGDGKIDLLLNSFNINFWKNVSDDPKKFVFRDMGPVDGFRLAGHDTCPAVVDFDKDGVPDLVVGAEDGFFYFLKNPRSTR